MAVRGRLALFLPSLAGGGAERVMLNIAQGLAERGFAVDLVLSRSEGPYLAQVPPTVRIVDLRSPRVALSLQPLVSYLGRERPVALLAALNHTNLVAMAAGRLTRSRLRVVVSIHNPISLETRLGVRRRLMPWLFGCLQDGAHAVVAVSEGVADDFAASTGIRRDRIEVIYNPVITPALAAAADAPPPHPWLSDPSRPVVVGVGRLMAQKNFSLLIRAFAVVARMTRARLVILGEGPERRALEALVKAHALEGSVCLPGFVANPYAWIARAAVLALSSDWEGLPTVLIESLALGTPVVSTDCRNGPREILRNGMLGALVPPGDAAALAGAIQKAIADGRRAVPPSLLKPFESDVVLDRYQSLLFDA